MITNNSNRQKELEKPSCLVIHVNKSNNKDLGRTANACLEEASGLALAIGLEISSRRIVTLRKPNPKTLIGIGLVKELSKTINQHCKKAHEFITIINSKLTPVQQQNLEKTWNCKVIDRTGLILEIFGERAVTKHGKIQVELAALFYQKSRLVRSWTHLERQRGGYGFMGGPGERQIESDKRQINNRINKIKSELKKIESNKRIQRRNRNKNLNPFISLVGYTNAGKSTLMNQLSKSNILAENKLFATLDTTVRKVVIENLPFLLSDTVGFIRKLPHQLIESFKSTLDEVRESDLLIHVVDISNKNFEDQIKVVNNTIIEIGAEDKPSLLVFNKIDMLSKSKCTKELEILVEELTVTWMSKLNKRTLFILSSFSTLIVSILISW